MRKFAWLLLILPLLLLVEPAYAQQGISAVTVTTNQDCNDNDPLLNGLDADGDGQKTRVLTDLVQVAVHLSCVASFPR